MKTGDKVTFTPDKGTTRQATVTAVSTKRGMAKVRLDGDPFDVKVRLDQLTSCTASGNNVGSSTKVRKTGSTPTTTGESKTMTTTRRGNAKELRKQAQALGIKGWEDMGRAELTAAVKQAEAGDSEPKSKKTKAARSSKRTKSTTSKPASKKAASKKAPARKAPATKKAAAAKKETGSKKATASKSEPVYTEPPAGTPTPDEPTNPFRKGSNLHVIFPILVPRGGKRRVLAERLQKKVALHPYSGETEVDTLDFDKRILLCAQTLRDKHGYAIERQGRGLEGTIRVFIPGSEFDPRSSNGKTKSKPSSKKKTRK